MVTECSEVYLGDQLWEWGCNATFHWNVSAYILCLMWQAACLHTYLCQWLAVRAPYPCLQVSQ
jgi:hypothetical protein